MLLLPAAGALLALAAEFALGGMRRVRLSRLGAVDVNRPGNGSGTIGGESDIVSPKAGFGLRSIP